MTGKMEKKWRKNQKILTYFSPSIKCFFQRTRKCMRKEKEDLISFVILVYNVAHLFPFFSFGFFGLDKFSAVSNAGM